MRSGKVKLDELENAITNETILISIMTANNEVGTIEPIKQIASIAKKHGIYFHTDSVQGIGNISKWWLTRVWNESRNGKCCRNCRAW